MRVMRESMEQAGLTPPLVESDRGNDLFVARYFFHHFLGAEDVAWLAHSKDLHLSDDAANARIVVREAGAINNGTRELTKVDTRAASQALRRLCDAGLLVQKGRGSATYCVPARSLLDSGVSSNPQPLLVTPPPYLVTPSASPPTSNPYRPSSTQPCATNCWTASLGRWQPG